MRNLSGLLCLMLAACGREASETSLPATPEDTVVARLLGGEPPTEGRGQGWLVSPAGESPAYGVQGLFLRDDRYLLLDSMTARIDGRAQWKVVAVLPVPRLEDDEFLLGAVCRSGGVPDPRVAAIVVPGEVLEPFYTDVRLAWMTDVTEHRFVEIPTDGIDCENVGYGL